MKCPMQIKTVKWVAFDQHLDFFQCDPDCALYDQENEQCYKATQAQALEKISKNLSNIKVSIAR